MKKNMKKILALLLILALLFAVEALQKYLNSKNEAGEITEDGSYYSAEDVAAYINSFGHLPENYVSKEKAQDAGWTTGNVEQYIKGACIGGEKFGNREGLLPAKNGRTYNTCDVDTKGLSDRGTHRLVYSNDGLIYLTEDSYASFTLLYGQEVLDKDNASHSGNSTSGNVDVNKPDTNNTQGSEDKLSVTEEGKYYDKDHVALYIHTYGKLPSNYVTKSVAKKAGWSGGSVEKYIEGAAIGGDRFGNNEGLLPKADGRQYYECDIDTKGQKTRGAKRILFSNDGYIYYTEDHYESFTLLYEGK